MKSGGSLLSGLLLITAPLVLLVIMNMFRLARSEKHISDHPCSSSCGDIHNITSPFRLVTDPLNCGDTRYTLYCVNNHTVLYLPVRSLRVGDSEYQSYYVQAINYNNYTIRLLDPNIQRDDCSSLPRNTLFHKALFGSPDEGLYESIIVTGLSKNIHQLLATVLFFNCERPVANAYIDAAPCVFNDEVFQSRSRQNYSYYYVFDGILNTSALEEPCWTGQMHVILKELVINQRNISSSDIQHALVYGFELSWLRSFDKTRSAAFCYIDDDDSNRVRCVSRCKFPDYRVDNIHKCGLFYSILGYIELYWNHLAIKYTVELLASRAIYGVPFLILNAIYNWRRRHLSMYDRIEAFLQSHDNLAPIRCPYEDIKMMTKGFKEKLGEGGFGSVYKGKLCSGRLVAIKILSKSKANGQDFINEVASVGRIHHVNVVRLIGFCFEGSKRALIYEFMSNGSLDKYIFSREGTDNSLNSKEIFEISLGIARGIEYLHQGCDMRILHFDIKPHNILLDENFIPKVSDFGLARISPLDNSIVSLTAARGTIGYIAPELFYKNIGGVSCKADVYSFGMLFMEMANKRKNVNPNAENSSQIYFPSWIYDQLKKGKDMEVEDATEEESKTIRKIITVALWCIQLKPCDRPSMSKVIEMLEGDIESLEMPPKPYLYPQEQEQGKHNVEDAGETSCSSTSSKREDSEESNLISNAC